MPLVKSIHFKLSDWIYVINWTHLLQSERHAQYFDSFVCSRVFKDIYFVIYGIISDFTDKGQFQYLTNLKGAQEGTYLYTTQFLSLR